MPLNLSTLHGCCPSGRVDEGGFTLYVCTTKQVVFTISSFHALYLLLYHLHISPFCSCCFIMSSDTNNHALQSSAKTTLSLEGKETIADKVQLPKTMEEEKYTVVTPVLDRNNTRASGVNPYLKKDTLELATIATNHSLPTESTNCTSNKKEPCAGKEGDVPTQLTGRQSTDSGYNNAKRLFNSFAQRFGYANIDTINDKNDEGNSQFPIILSCFANWLLRQAPTNKPGELYMPKSHLQILSQVKESIKQLNPKSIAWATEDTWYAKMRVDLESRSKDQRTAEALTSLDVVPIYRQVDMNIYGSRPGAYNGDLHNIILNMLRTRDKDLYQDRLLLSFAWNSDARGGEMKFLNYQDWFYDPFLNCLDLVWREPKNDNEYRLCFVSDKNLFSLDIYHSLGSYWCSEGLYRNKLPEKLDGTDHFTFHNILYKDYHDGWVASRVTTLVRKHLSIEVVLPNDTVVQGRSLRKGATTTMACSKYMQSQFIGSRSGHATSDNSDIYISTIPALTLPGAKALAGWEHAHADVYQPSLKPLEDIGIPPSTIDSFMDELYHTELQYFKRGGVLWLLLKTTTAALLRFVKDMDKEVVNNDITRCLLNALERAKISGGLTTLYQWSQLVKEDFERMNQQNLLKHLSSGGNPHEVNPQMKLLENHIKVMVTKDEHERMMKQQMVEYEKKLNLQKEEFVELMKAQLREQTNEFKEFMLSNHFQQPPMKKMKNKENATNRDVLDGDLETLHDERKMPAVDFDTSVGINSRIPMGPATQAKPKHYPLFDTGKGKTEAKTKPTAVSGSPMELRQIIISMYEKDSFVLESTWYEKAISLQYIQGTNTNKFDKLMVVTKFCVKLLDARFQTTLINYLSKKCEKIYSAKHYISVADTLDQMVLRALYLLEVRNLGRTKPVNSSATTTAPAVAKRLEAVLNQRTEPSPVGHQLLNEIMVEIQDDLVEWYKVKLASGITTLNGK
jgi:hypothetical protein